MKKMKELKLIDWFILITITFLPNIIIFNLYRGLDSDIWYLLAEGRYIIEHGIYHIDPLSLHEGLDIVVQNWLFAVIISIVYSFFKLSGIYYMVIFTNMVICFLLYKLAMLISDNNKLMSVIVTVLTDISLSMYFIVSKPQIFSFIIILLLLYLLELYIKTDDSKYLKYIPFLSLIEINMHAAYWGYIILFMIPYIIDSFKNNKLMLQGYRKKPLLITFFLSIVFAFINPYGYSAIIFIFKCFGNTYMQNFVPELKSFTFNSFSSFHVFAICLLVYVLFVLNRKGQLRVRYICLFVGTLLIAMVSMKGMSYFMLVAFFPLALLFKKFKIKHIMPKIVNILLGIAVILILALNIYSYVQFNKNKHLEYEATEAIDAIEVIAGNYPARIYTSINDGGYTEFRGYKAYIDPRVEAFLKVNNHKEDILYEYYNFQMGNITTEELLNKYNFDFLLINANDRLIFDEEIKNYMLIYSNSDTLYKIYIRSDLVNESQK